MEILKFRITYLSFILFLLQCKSTKPQNYYMPFNEYKELVFEMPSQNMDTLSLLNYEDVYRHFDNKIAEGKSLAINQVDFNTKAIHEKPFYTTYNIKKTKGFGLTFEIKDKFDYKMRFYGEIMDIQNIKTQTVIIQNMEKEEFSNTNYIVSIVWNMQEGIMSYQTNEGKNFKVFVN